MTPDRTSLPACPPALAVRLAARLVAAQLAAVSLLAGYQYDRANNGGFEQDVNRDAQPDGWRLVRFQSEAVATWDDAVAHAGRRSVRLDNSKHPANRNWRANIGRWAQSSRWQVKGGETYTVRGWIKTALAEGRATFAIAWFNEKKWLKENSCKPVTGSTDWVERKVTAPAPPEATAAAIYLNLGSGVGSAWFDDVAGVQGSGAPANFATLDLRSAVNTGFADEKAGDGRGGWTDQGPNDARAIPSGRQVWRGVPFDVIDPAANNGKSCLILRGRARPDLPASASFAVNRTCDTVYFLHGCAWAGKAGRLVARYIVTYEDGARERVRLRSGREIVDWWAPRDAKDSVSGWEGANPHKDRIGLSIFAWTNPHPDKQIKEIRVESTGKDPTPMLAAVTTGDGPAVFPEKPLPLQFTDTSGWYEWAFALDSPKLGEIDLSHLLDAPAGKHGFVTVGKDGHFVFEDGTAGRFFGTNVGGPWCAPSKENAEMLAERFARHGINLLRLHSPDSVWGGLIDYRKGTSQEFDEEWLDRYDYFVAQLKERGVYVYFDLYDYRTFKDGDGVREASKMDPHWRDSSKGATIFDRRMIELQKDFATKLLTHRNPYTGNRYVDEPALAVQEITNENSLFYLHNMRLILPSYREDLTRLWNQWLIERFKDRDGLARAWTNAAGEGALLPHEDPGKGTVAMPTQFLYADLRNVPWQGLKGPARCNAVTRFLYERQTAYFEEMQGHLRGLGLKCPITGTNQDFSDAGNRANAVCDFTTRNNYWCHPNMHAKPFVRFSNKSFVRSQAAAVANPIANVASSTVVGKPMISPEFNAPWPNEWRAEMLPMMTAYGLLQGWDGLLYFACRPDEAPLAFFGNQSDPVRWGQMPLAALMFHRRDLAAAKVTVHVGCARIDAFATRPARISDRYSPYRVFSYLSKLRNAYFDTAYEGDADVVVASGHSAAADYSRARRAIVFADSAHTDEAGATTDRGLSARRAVPGLRTKTVQGEFDTEIVPESVPKGAELLQADGRPFGVLSDSCLAAPCASQIGLKQGPAWLHRLYLQAASRWGLPGAAPLEEAGRVFRSDTGELVWNCEEGLFTAVAPRLRIAVGFMRELGPVRLGQATVTCRTPFAAISVISLDNDPIETSRRLLVTAVARAENTGQACLRDKASGGGGVDADTGLAFLGDYSSIAERGRTPVLVEPVDVTLQLASNRNLKAHPLGPKGERRTPLPVRPAEAGIQLETREAQSPWILLAE